MWLPTQISVAARSSGIQLQTGATIWVRSWERCLQSLAIRLHTHPRLTALLPPWARFIVFNKRSFRLLLAAPAAQ